MILPAKALLALSVLTSVEALAHSGLQVRNATVRNEGLQSTSATSYRAFRPASARLSNPQDLGPHIKTSQGKGPVDVMSLSLGGALAGFFVLAMFRRRKTLKAAARSAQVELPLARVLPPGSRGAQDKGNTHNS